MDYGTFLGKLGKKYSHINQKSKHYTKQSSFRGSNREARSKILSYVLEKKSPVQSVEIQKQTALEKERFESAFQSLLKDNTLELFRGRVRLK